jgi:hypothetical protein
VGSNVEYPDEIKYLLEQYEVDLNELIKKTGTSKITENDVMEYIKEKYYPKRKTTMRLDPVRRTIMKRLSTSYKTSVHVTLFKTINVEPLIEEKRN